MLKEQSQAFALDNDPETEDTETEKDEHASFVIDTHQLHGLKKLATTYDIFVIIYLKNGNGSVEDSLSNQSEIVMKLLETHNIFADGLIDRQVYAFTLLDVCLCAMF